MTLGTDDPHHAQLIEAEYESTGKVLFFPTKKHWRAPSQLSWIDDGLADLIRVVEENEIRSIAILRLGAGNGGLD